MRLAPRKRPMQLLRTLRETRDLVPSATRIRGKVIGEGPERRSLERYLRRTGMDDWVELTGRLGRDEIKAVYERADVFVAPANLESFGIAALEARCAGLPVLAKANSGIREFVSDEREGLLAATDGELVSGLVRLLRSPGLRGADRRAQPHGPARGDLGRRAAPHRGGVRPRGRGAQGPYPGPVSDVGWPFVKGHGTGNDFVAAPRPHRRARPDAVGGRRDLRPAHGDRRATACCASSPPRWSPTAELGVAADDAARGRVVHGLPQRRRHASPRCAATACGCSPPTSSPPGWQPPGPLRVATRAGGARRRRARRPARSPCGWARRGSRAGPASRCRSATTAALAARRRRRHGQPARGRVRRRPGRAGTAAHALRWSGRRRRSRTG